MSIFIFVFINALFFSFFFFNDTATTEIYTLSLTRRSSDPQPGRAPAATTALLQPRRDERARAARSEEHTSELQSRVDLVCRLLLEKKQQVHLVNCPVGGRNAGRRGVPD